ncbi:MAG: hypothetical protein CSA62_03695 [Planctomycetota bacterium]|nr:MAG: hypothetical protein CSA62_03695 [Planctomycetota bacterium]
MNHQRLIIRICAILASAFLLQSCGRKLSVPAPLPRPVSLVEAHRHPLREARFLPGRLRAPQRTQLAFERGGRVVEVMVEFGDSFEAGALLAKLDDVDARLMLAQRRAELAEAEARCREAQRQFDRFKALVAAKTSSPETLENAEAALSVAKARVNAAKVRVDVASKLRRDTLLHAPYAGRISRRLLEPGQVVAAGQPVFRVQSKTERLEVDFAVSEFLLPRLKIGDKHAVRILATESKWLPARILEIGADAGAGRLFDVRLGLEGDVGKALPGMSVEVRLRLDDDEGPQAFRLPLAAIVADMEPRVATGAAVFCLDEEPFKARKLRVEIVHLDSEYVWVRGELKEGQRIVTRGASYLQDGQAVRLAEQALYPAKKSPQRAPANGSSSEKEG